ncbi:MAG TPA: outer membrane beta-barrel domain-containing protein [Steroidobacteraceae bacterium]|nr:outer membrane beta-barrel domain-containing protein [Steroidobacteraceae bacterium]
METRVRGLLLTALLLTLLPGCATVHRWRAHRAEVRAAREEARAEAAQANPSAGSDSVPPGVVQPQIERRNVKVPRIRSSNFEIGAHYGVMSIEDFGSHPAYGFDLAYHMTEDLFVRAEVGRATGGLTSFETLGGNIRLLTEGERRFTYYDLGLGYNFLPGEAFFGRSRAMTSSFYVIGGAGATQFAGDKKFTVTVGGGYQVLPTDRLAVHVGFEDHMFQTDLLGAEKLTNNLEAGLGIAVYF